MNKFAPVIIPTLCRSVHFIRLIESLKNNGWAKFTDVYVGLDYPPNAKYECGWAEIGDYLKNTDWGCFNSFHVIEHLENVGASKNTLYLTNLVKTRYTRWIYLEDDAEVAPNFLEYINKCLDWYEDDPNVVAVCGYSYPVEWQVSQGATCLKQNFNVSMWGTGFWVAKEKCYREFITSKQTIKELPHVIRYKKYCRMIDACLREYIPVACCGGTYGGRFISSCTDIGMRAYLAVADKYVITPVVSKVRNHGFDGSGLYCQNIDVSLDGSTAGTYNYSIQPIDEDETFTICENTLNNVEENRFRLNKFDMRTLEQMRLSRTLIWMCENLGIWPAKMCYLLYIPIDIVRRAYRKYICRQRRL